MTYILFRVIRNFLSLRGFNGLYEILIFYKIYNSKSRGTPECMEHVQSCKTCQQGGSGGMLYRSIGLLHPLSLNLAERSKCITQSYNV